MLEESELVPHRERLGEMVLKDLEGAADAAALQAAIDIATGAAGSTVEAALSVARSRLAELRNSEKWKADRVAEGVDHLMPERPTEHMCAISQEPMVNPVLAEDGFTYERSQIEEWLKNSLTSPKTREEMGTDVRPNKDLGRLIRDWEEQEHKRCMAMAQAAPPPPLRQTTSDLVAQRDELDEEIQKRKKAKLATAQGASSSTSDAAATDSKDADASTADEK